MVPPATTHRHIELAPILFSPLVAADHHDGASGALDAVLAD